MEKVIEVKNLTKEYKKGTKAVDDLSLEVYKGEIVGLLGPNGSGKSTTINCILSLLKYSSGAIKVFGKEMNPDSYDIKSKIGVVFQDVSVFDELTVYENLDYFCGLYIKDKAKRKELVEEAVELVGLQDFKKYRPKQLSGGLLRRLNIACGIAHKPKLIFFDEPTVAVDPQSRNNILSGIKKLRDEGATIVYTTHYMEEAEILCDRIIILDKGNVLASGTSDELKELADIEEKVTVEVDDLDEKYIAKISDLKNVDVVTYTGNILLITYKKGKNNISDMVEFLKNNRIKYNKIFSERPTLNDVFLELTGKELRD
ncbi:MAG: ABC transporter ATP-binding protein [Bacilli bacterium]|nr:ABC transporter ATP-binding protein [Bacilli bacterium]